MKTAMQQLVEFIDKQINDSNKLTQTRALMGIVGVIETTFLEKEKQQIIDAYERGFSMGEVPLEIDDDFEKQAEQYFKETYK